MFLLLPFSLSRKISVSTIKDPNFGSEFYIKNDGHNNFLKGEDINVIPSWEKGYSGEGKTITLLSGGARLTHIDLKNQINANLNYNFVNKSKDPSQDVNTSKIGTEVLGMTAAEINEHTYVGVAPDAKVGSVSFDISKSYTQKEIADIIGDENNLAGDVIILPHRLVSTEQQWINDDDISFAFAQLSGKDDNSSAYVIPTGNDGHLGADTSMFPGMCSVFVIPVGASTVRGASAYYSTGGACVSVVAPSTGLPDDITPEMRDFPKLGVLDHMDDELGRVVDGKTEHAAAEVAGVIALMRDANPKISPTDIQIILQHTATKTDPNSPLWWQNKGGYWYNPKLGFGRVNADLAIETAKNWGTKKSELSISEGSYRIQDGVIISTTEDKMLPITIEDDGNFFIFGSLVLETSKVDLSGMRITIESPSGSNYTVLNPTSYKAKADNNDIKITEKTKTTRIGFRCFFGEKTAGTWNVYLHHVDGISDDVLSSLELSLCSVASPDFSQTEKQQASPAEMGYDEYESNSSFSLESDEVQCGRDINLVQMKGAPENYQNIKVPLYLVDLSNNRTMPVTSFLWTSSTKSVTIRLPCMYKTGKYGLSIRFENTLYQISHKITLKNDEETKITVTQSEKASNEFNIKWANKYTTFKAPGIYQKVIVAATDIESNKVLFVDTFLDNGAATINLPSGANVDNVLVHVVPIYGKEEPYAPAQIAHKPTPVPSSKTPTPATATTVPSSKTATPNPEKQEGKSAGLTKTTKTIIIACSATVIVAIIVIIVVCLCRPKNNIKSSEYITDVLLT